MKEKNSVASPDEKRKKQRFEEEVIAFIKDEFLRRQNERIKFERQWELNMQFLSGNQYCGVDGRGEIAEEDKTFFWQSRLVFNHIAPIVESRLAKFSRVTPEVSVRPLSNDDVDVKNAVLSERLIKEAFKKVDVTEVVKQVNAWCETCGTAFYKVVWNNRSGRFVGVIDTEEVFEGDVNVLPVSPFEIFPDSIYTEKLSDCQSLIHARVMPTEKIKEKYGVIVKGEEIGVYNLTRKSGITLNKNDLSSKVENAQIVIEYYEKPTKLYPNGRLITVSDDKLLYYGELPYVNGDNGERSYPFVKQESTAVSGCFFGTSVIERLIPVQKAFNAVKNRKHEFLNRLSMGVMAVEDGSIDVDDLTEDGLSPGKVLVYRQGATPPEMMKETSVPSDFSDEENKLLDEFVSISGLSDVSSSKQNSHLSSGSALELLVSQDNERMTVNADAIRRSYLLLAKQILKLYAQFISGIRSVNYQDSLNKTKVCYADAKTAKSDDVFIQGENELMYTPKERKEMILRLYESGVLSDEDGKVSQKTKEKILSLLGYGDLDAKKGLSALHEEKSQKENEILRSRSVEVDLLDDHEIHVDEHVRYFLTEHDELSESEKQNYLNHVQEHKKYVKKLNDKILTGEN